MRSSRPDSSIVEQSIEDDVVDFARRNGWLSRKLKWIGRRAGPDRFFAKNGQVLLVEFKRTGREPDPLQKREIRRLQSYGVVVHVVDNAKDGYALFA